MYFLLERWDRVSPKPSRSNPSELLEDVVREILWKKKREFMDFNKEVAASIAQVLDRLTPYYALEECALRLRLSK